MSAVAVVDGVWLVGSPDPHSPAFTSPWDANQYLVTTDAGSHLVDAGTGLASDAWLANVAEVRPLDDIRAVLLTHDHADHAGGAADARRAGLRVLASPASAAALVAGDEERTSLAAARTAGVYPASYRLQPADVTAMVPDDDVAPSGAPAVLAAPGHCDGHVVVVARTAAGRCLFSGDVVFAGGTIALQPVPDCRPAVYAATLERLDALDVDVLLPGHGDPVREHAAVDVARAAAAFRALAVPPNRVPAPGFTP